MKKIILITILISVLFISAEAQKSKTKFAIGLSSSILSVPIINEDYTFMNTSVKASINFDRFNLKIGSENSNLFCLDTKQFDKSFNFLFGLGYYIIDKPENNYTVELFLNNTNSFSDFVTFKNYNTEIGINFMVFKTFYLGTGLRYSYNNVSYLSHEPINNLYWFWQMGFQLTLGKKQN